MSAAGMKQRAKQSDTDQQRSTTVDMAKGLAIVLVVYGHCLRGLVAAGVIAPGSPIMVTDYVIYTFHMPLFFFLSGLFAMSARRRTRDVFALGLLLNIVYPYFLWSSIQSLIQIILAGSGAINGSMDLHRLLQIAYRPVAPYWFLYALFFCRLMVRAFGAARPTVILAGCALAFAVVSALIGGGVLQDVTYGLAYFALGMVARVQGWMAVLQRGPVVVAGLAMAFLVMAVGCLAAGIPERLPVPATLLGIAATIALCGWLDRTGKAAAVGLLGLLGRYSMSIFVMHILVLALVRTVFLHMLHISSPALIMPVAIVPALAIPMMIQAVLVRWRLSTLAGLPFSARRGEPVPVLGGRSQSTLPTA